MTAHTMSDGVTHNYIVRTIYSMYYHVHVYTCVTCYLTVSMGSDTKLYNSDMSTYVPMQFLCTNKMIDAIW